MQSLWLKSFAVDGLFGFFDHTVDFNARSPIRIVHGENGVGKTQVLKLIHGFFRGEFDALGRVPFDRCTVELNDGRRVEISQQEGDGPDKRVMRLRAPELLFSPISLPASAEAEEWRYRVGSESYSIERAALLISRRLPGLRRVGERYWLDETDSEVLSIDEVMRRHPGIIQPTRARGSAVVFEPTWLESFRRDIRTHLVETQRLLSEPKQERSWAVPEQDAIRDTVEQYSNEMRNLIETTVAKYGEQSQELDREFPLKLADKYNTTATDYATKKRLQGRLARLEKKRQALMRVGLLEAKDLIDFSDVSLGRVDVRKMLSVYLDDSETKLHAFDEVERKLTVLTDLIERSFSHKRFRLSKDRGFEIRVGDRLIPPNRLSSGEQHRLVLLHEMLFKVEANELVMIDEPELSLHIQWQMQFLSDLRRVIAVNPFRVLIATHAPDVINNEWQLTTMLKAREGDQPS